MQLSRLDELVKDELGEQERLLALQHVSQCFCCQTHLRELSELGGLETLRRFLEDAQTKTSLAKITTDEDVPDAQQLPNLLASGRLVSGSKASVLQSLATVPAVINRQKLVNYSASGTLERIGKYEVLSKIGEGGFGRVYHVRDFDIGKHLAIKLIKPEAQNDSRSQLISEAQRCCKVRHANVVSVFDVASVDGIDFMVMELIDGDSLNAYMRQPEVTLKTRVRWLHEIGAGLAALHSQNVLHLDIKPSNILIDSQGLIAKITDIGLERESDLSSSSTATTQVRAQGGTPAYMSPEQIDHAPLDQRSDIFSLGILMYELLTHQRPFEGDTKELAEKIRFTQPAHPNQLRRSLPRDLCTITLKCLEKNPANRYQRVQEFVDDLQRWSEDRPILAQPISAYRRMILWSKRNWISVSATSIAVAAIVSALTIQKKNIELTEQKQALESSFQSSRDMLSSVTTILVKDQNPASTQLRSHLLEETQAQLTFIADNSSHMISEPEERAIANFSIALNLAALYKPTDGREYWKNASADFELLASRKSLSNRQLETLVEYYSNKATLSPLLSSLLEPNEAVTQNSYEHAVSFARRLHERQPETAKFKEYLATALANLGAFSIEQKQPKSALAPLKESITLAAQIDDPSPTLINLFAIAHFNLAKSLTDLNEDSQALKLVRESRGLWKSLPSQWRDEFGRNVQELIADSALLSLQLDNQDTANLECFLKGLDQFRSNGFPDQQPANLTDWMINAHFLLSENSQWIEQYAQAETIIRDVAKILVAKYVAKKAAGLDIPTETARECCTLLYRYGSLAEKQSAMQALFLFDASFNIVTNRIDQERNLALSSPLLIQDIIEDLQQIQAMPNFGNEQLFDIACVCSLWAASFHSLADNAVTILESPDVQNLMKGFTEETWNSQFGPNGDLLYLAQARPEWYAELVKKLRPSQIPDQLN